MHKKMYSKPYFESLPSDQVYTEAMKMPQCSAIHMTEVVAEVQCDTFFPSIDPSRWRLWSSSPAKRHKDMQYSFLCYTATGSEEAAQQLPPGINTRHEEYQA